MYPQCGNGWWAHHGNYRLEEIDVIRQTVTDLRGGLLGHDLAQGTEAPLQTGADARIGIRPGDGLLHPPVGRAENLLGGEPEQHLQTHEGEILPATRRGGLPHNPSPPPTVRAAAAVLVRLDCQVQLFIAVLEVKAGDLHAFQV